MSTCPVNAIWKGPNWFDRHGTLCNSIIAYADIQRISFKSIAFVLEIGNPAIYVLCFALLTSLVAGQSGSVTSKKKKRNSYKVHHKITTNILNNSNDEPLINYFRNFFMTPSFSLLEPPYICYSVKLMMPSCCKCVCFRFLYATWHRWLNEFNGLR